MMENGKIVEARNKPSGDCAKLREALAYARDVLAKWKKDTPMLAWGEIQEAIRRADAALSAPPRNCDVGTARQQEKRHKEEACLKSACPKHEGFASKACKGCFALWAQMPCKKKGECK